MTTPIDFVEALKALRFEHTFNPYSDRCAVHDRADAPHRRAAMLLKILESAAGSEIDSLWVGRDLGYRGGRRTGLAFTDDVHLAAHAKRWGVSPKVPTMGDPVAERTAAVVWSMLNEIDSAVFLWNVFPLHPHKPDDPFTNRAHRVREREAGEALLDRLVRLLKPRRLVPVGKDAASAARRVCGHRSVFPVRHPSYGGQSEFLRQTRALYGLG